MTNEKGFTTIGYLLILKLLLIAGTVVLLSYFLIKSYSQAQNNCRRHSLEAQKILAQNVNDLIDLNPTAETLRNTQDYLKMMMAATAAYPPAYAVFQSAHEINVGLQYALKFRQEALFSTAIMKANKKLAELKNATPQLKLKTIYNPAYLYMKRSPQHRIAQNFEPMKNFEHLQTVLVSWKVDEERFLPLIEKKFLTAMYEGKSKQSFPGNLKGTCVSTLEKKGDLWQPQLKRALSF